MTDNETTTANQATIDTPVGTVLVLREGKGSAKAGALAVVEGLGMLSNNTLKVRWLRDQGELADGGWFAWRFDIHRLQVGDRVRAEHAISTREREYEGVIESVTPAGNFMVRIESPENAAGRTMGFFDTSLVKIEDAPEDLWVWDEDPSDELAEWERELLAPEFTEGDIVVITDYNGDTESAWIGKRFTVWSDEGDSVRLNNAEIDTRPDIPGSITKFFWDKDQLRAFDPKQDFRVGDLVSYHNPSNRGVVTSLENGFETGNFGGDIKVRFTEGEGLAGWEGGASRWFCKLVGHEPVTEGEVVEEEPAPSFEVGDRVVIVGNTDEYHYLAVGTEGTVLSYDAEDDEYMVEGVDFDGYGETQWVDPSDLKPAPVYAEYEDFGFEAGQEIGSVDVLEDLPVGTVLYYDTDRDDPIAKTYAGFFSFCDDGSSYKESIEGWVEDDDYAVMIAYVPA
jgi:hypothetical protein